MSLVLTAYDGGPALAFSIDPNLLRVHDGPVTFLILIDRVRMNEDSQIRSARVVIDAPPIVRVARDPAGEERFLRNKRRAAQIRQARAAQAARPTLTAPATGKESA